MKKIGLIIQREYITRVRKKTFIIFTILFPLLIVGLIAGSVLISVAAKKDKAIAIHDEGNFFNGSFRDFNKIHFKFENTPLDQLEKDYGQLGYDAIIYVPKDLSFQYVSNISGIQYLTNDVLGFEDREIIKGEIENKLRNYMVQQANIDQEFFKQLNEVNITMTVNDPAQKEADDKSLMTMIATVIGYVSGVLIYITLFIYGVSVMRGVMEEKNNRIVEVMSSSVKPFQMMIGKVIGIGAVGLTQFTIWIIIMIGAYFAVFLFLGPQFAEQAANSRGGSQQEMMQQAGQFSMQEIQTALQSVSWLKIIGCFIWYFLGGYLLYGALYAAMGSTIGEDSADQQSPLSFIVGLPIIISFFIMMSIVNDPHSKLAVWTSIIPFTSPIIMPARLAFDPPLWQLILSMFMLIVGFLFTIWIAGRIYRTGILLYGKKVTIREISRWVFYKQ